MIGRGGIPGADLEILIAPEAAAAAVAPDTEIRVPCPVRCLLLAPGPEPAVRCLCNNALTASTSMLSVLGEDIGNDVVFLISPGPSSPLLRCDRSDRVLVLFP